MTDISVREIAADALTEILEEGRFCHSVLARTLDKYAFLPRQDRAFLKRLVGGTVECRIRLDYILDSFSSVRVKKMKPFIRTLLRMSVYQMLFLQRIPAAAACNEAVALAKKYMAYYTGYTGKYAGCYKPSTGNYVRNGQFLRWNRATLADPDGYMNMTADQILKDLYGF